MYRENGLGAARCNPFVPRVSTVSIQYPFNMGHDSSHEPDLNANRADLDELENRAATPPRPNEQAVRDWLERCPPKDQWVVADASEECSDFQEEGSQILRERLIDTDSQPHIHYAERSQDEDGMDEMSDSDSSFDYFESDCSECEEVDDEIRRRNIALMPTSSSRRKPAKRPCSHGNERVIVTISMEDWTYVPTASADYDYVLMPSALVSGDSNNGRHPMRPKLGQLVNTQHVSNAYIEGKLESVFTCNHFDPFKSLNGDIPMNAAIAIDEIKSSACSPCLKRRRPQGAEEGAPSDNNNHSVSDNARRFQEMYIIARPCKSKELITQGIDPSTGQTVVTNTGMLDENEDHPMLHRNFAFCSVATK